MTSNFDFKSCPLVKKLMEMEPIPGPSEKSKSWVWQESNYGGASRPMENELWREENPILHSNPSPLIFCQASNAAELQQSSSNQNIDKTRMVNQEQGIMQQQRIEENRGQPTPAEVEMINAIGRQLSDMAKENAALKMENNALKLENATLREEMMRVVRLNIQHNQN